MLVSSLFKSYKSIISKRLLYQTVNVFQIKPDSVENASAPTTHAVSKSVVGPRMHYNTKFDKWILEWMKKFPKGQVPDKVTEDMLYQTKSRARVKAANYMTAFAVIGCILAVISGKTAKSRGDTIAKRNEERLAPYK